MAASPASSIDDRSEPRDAVFHRTRLILPDRRSVPTVIVNLSPHGLMTRVDVDVAPGEWIRLTLPVVGEIEAVVRWSLGGRLGCKFARGIEPTRYGGILVMIAA